MLYLDRVVEIPEHGVTLIKREHFIYVKQYADSWKNADGSRNTNRRQPIVGRLVRSDPGCTSMYPNETYYELRGLPKPPHHDSKLGTPGRKSAAVYAEGSASYPGFALLAAAALIDCGALPLIEKHFGAVKGQQMMFLAAHYVAGHHSLECLDYHAVKHNVFVNARGLSKQSAAELLAEGIPPECVRSFFDEWIPLAADQDIIAYDVTALMTKAQNLVLTKRGYAHGSPEPPQVNYALMVSRRTGLPLFFSRYTGSITAEANLQRMLDRRLPGTMTLVLDRDGAALQNIRCLHEQGVRFLMGVPSTAAAAMERLEEFNQESEVPFDGIITELRKDGTYAEDVARGRTEDFNWQGEKLKLYLYRNETNHLKQSVRLHNNVLACRAYLAAAGTLPENGEMAEAVSCFKPEDRGRGTQWVLDEELYHQKQRNYGSFALLSSPECAYSAQEALYLFRSREMDEEIFRGLKTDLASLPLRTGNDEALDGKFFVLFVAAIIRRHLLIKLRDILQAHQASFTRLTETLEDRRFEVRGDGTAAPASLENSFEAAVLERMYSPACAEQLGLKRSYVIKPKRRAGR